MTLESQNINPKALTQFNTYRLSTELKEKIMAQGKVTASSLNLRDNPDTSAKQIQSLSTGTLVDIVKTVAGGNYPFGSGTRNDWLQVTVSGNNGFVAAAFVTSVTSPPISSSIKELRGVWIGSHFNSSVLTSSVSITNALNFLQANGFNTVFPAVWNRGFTAFPSQVMENNRFPKQDPGYGGFDPIKEIVAQGKSLGMAVIPWFEYGFAASPDLDGGHILQTKPQWSALDSSGNKVRHGGLTWMNSLDPEVQQFMLDLITEVIQTYDVDGIQGDDRLPAMPFNAGYDTATKAQFKAKFGRDPLPPKKDSKGKETSVGQDDVWVKFRANKLTQYLETLFNQVKATKATCAVFMAPTAFPFGLNNLMQDSDTWVKKNIVDFLNPQLYRESFDGGMITIGGITRQKSKYKPEIQRIKVNFNASQQSKFAPGIAFTANTIDLSTSDIVQSVQLNRSSGLGGQVFFSFEGLTKNSNQMAITLSTKGGYNQIASLPSSFVIT
jgi:uncharacterized lipoprotein YddW (UPF0748 family)